MELCDFGKEAKNECPSCHCAVDKYGRGHHSVDDCKYLKVKLENLERYFAVVDAARDAYKLLMIPEQYEDCDRGQRFKLDVDGDEWGIPRESLRKALSNLYELRKV